MSPLTRGWLVAFSGLAINLAVSVLCAWRAIALVLQRPATEGGQYLWSAQQASEPYILAVTCFAISLPLGSLLERRVGSRWLATAGGVLVGVGLLIASLSPSHLASAEVLPLRMMIGFGVLTGTGIGLSCAATLPAALKWFSAGRRGAAVVMVLSGVALAVLGSMQPASWLVRTYGVHDSFLFMGVVFFVLIVGLAQLLTEPPKGYVPPGSYVKGLPAIAPHTAAVDDADPPAPSEPISTPRA